MGKLLTEYVDLSDIKLATENTEMVLRLYCCMATKRIRRYLKNIN